MSCVKCSKIQNIQKNKKIDPLIALLEDEGSDTKIEVTKKSGAALPKSSFKSKTREASTLHTIGQKKVTKPVSTPTQSKTESIRNMWGNLNPNAARFRLANPRVSTLAPRDTPKITTKPTTKTPVWHHYTSKPNAWVQQVSQKMIAQNNDNLMNEYVMVNGVRRRIPDNVRFRLEQQRTTVPPNMQREAVEIMAKVNRRNQYIKSAYGKRKRRAAANDIDIFDALRSVRKSQGKPSTKREAGFLMKKDGLTIIKCKPPSFKTPSPYHVNPKHLNPELLAEMLKERKDVIKVKQSVFSRLFS